MWAQSPQDFLRIMREALESKYVSENLHHWIDLIFGFKQRGDPAIAADNGTTYVVFKPYTYEGGIELDSISDQDYKKMIEIEIQECGQTPKQIFKVPHAPRSYLPNVLDPKNPCEIVWNKEIIAKKPAGVLTELQAHSKRVSSIYKFDSKIISSGHDGEVLVGSSKKISLQRPILTTAVNSQGTLYASVGEKMLVCSLNTGKIVNEFKGHSDRITSISCHSDDIIVTGSWDYSIKLWDTRTSPSPVYQCVYNDEITCLCKIHNNPHGVICGDMQGNIIFTDFRVGKLSQIETGNYIFTMASFKDNLLVCNSNTTDIRDCEGNVTTSFNIFGVQSVCSDGNFIFTGKEEEELQIWHVSQRSCLYKWAEISNVTCVYFDGNDILAGSIEGNIYLIN